MSLLVDRYNHDKPTGLYYVCHEGKDVNAIVKGGDNLTFEQAFRLFTNTEITTVPVAIYAKMQLGAKRTLFVKSKPIALDYVRNENEAVSRKPKKEK